MDKLEFSGGRVSSGPLLLLLSSVVCVYLQLLCTVRLIISLLNSCR